MVSQTSTHINPQKEIIMIEAINPETTPAKRGRGRPRVANPLTVLQRVRRHRLKQDRINEEHMRELVAVIKSLNITE